MATKLPLSRFGREIANLIGEDAAMRLFEQLGGDHISLPGRFLFRRAPSESYQRLIDAAGEENAQAIAQWCQGEQLSIPVEAGARRFIRNTGIVRDYSNGTKARELCRKYRLSRRQIFHILKTTIEVAPETSV